MGQFILDELDSRIEKNFPDKINDPMFRPLVYGLFDWRFEILTNKICVSQIKLNLLYRCKMENLLSGCSSIFELSLRNFAKYENLKGNKMVPIPNGYLSIVKKVVEPHLEKLNPRLILNHELTKILLCTSLSSSKTDRACEHCKYSNDPNQIVVRLKDRVENKEVLAICERVVCTVSLGVLKARLHELIEPSEFIPREKLDAVSRLGFGTNNKVGDILFIIFYLFYLISVF